MSIQTPDWVKHAVFYQIFPDRFARSLRLRPVRGIRFKPWGTPPVEQGFQGGDLLGIVDKLDYLHDLGVTALYLNPIFAAAANHRYHTFDYFAVDPLLGGKAALRELLDAAHARNMRVILDGVFNHASRGFWAFHHILETGADSPYLDWFLVQNWPLRPYHSNAAHPANYAAWWGLPALPKFNFDNPGVYDYFLRVSEYWIDFGIDGWRLDVPAEIDNAAFWRDFRRVVKRANPEAYLVGELWDEGRDWLRGDRFDAVMNYALSRAAFGFFARDTLRSEYEPGGYALRPLAAADFAQEVERLLALYEAQIVQAQLNLLDSHDTARAPWIVRGEQSAQRLCVLFQMTMPGAPCIYYGDEVGLSSAGDPHCRAAFPWHDVGSWDRELFDFYRRAVALRHRHAVLRTGNVHTLHAAGDVYVMQRTLNSETAVVAFNTARHAQQVSFAIAGRGTATRPSANGDGRPFRQVWPPPEATPSGTSDAILSVYNGAHTRVTLPARAAMVWIAP